MNKFKLHQKEGRGEEEEGGEGRRGKRVMLKEKEERAAQMGQASVSHGDLALQGPPY